MTIEVYTAEKILKKLLAEKFGNLEKLSSISSEIVSHTMQSTLIHQKNLE